MAISLGDIKKKKIKVSPIENNNSNKTYNPAPTVNNKTNERRTYNLGEIRENNITVTPLSKIKSKIMAPALEEKMIRNSINNKINENISKKIVSGGVQNDIHNMNMANIGNSNNKVKFESVYHNTGKKYGDYYYDNYETQKDKPIYERDGKYFFKTEDGYQPIGQLDKNGKVMQNVLTSKESEAEEIGKAKKLGYKDNITKITTQEYDDAQETFKKLKKEYKLSDKELNNWIKTGDLPVNHISMQTNSMNNLKQKAEEYRIKIGIGKIQQYDQQGFDINNQIYMDTHNMTDEEKQQYINFITGKKDPTQKNQNTFFKSSSLWDDGYDFGDVTKTTLGTIGNAGYSLLKGTGKFVEGTGDFATNLIGSGLELVGSSDNEKKDVTTIHNNKTYIGYKYGNQNYWYDEKSKTMYDENWKRIDSFNLDRFQKRYTYSNGVAEFGRQMKEQTVNDDTSEVFDEILHGNDLRKTSVLGNKSEAMLESLGQAIPLMGAGGSVGGLYGEGASVATTSGLTFSNTYGNAKTEAIRNGATEKEAIESAFVQASAETISEQFFDAIPGAKSAGWGEKLVGKVGNGVEKYLGSRTAKIVTKALDISGEGFEEIISNMLTAGGNDIVHYFDKDFTYGMENQSGNILDDMTKAMTSQDSMDSFVSAIITSAILNAGSSKINSSKRNQVINEIVRTYAEENNISFKEAKSRLRVDGDNVEFNKSVNTSNLPNNLSVEQRNINNNINNQVNENIQNSMVRTQNNNISETINNKQQIVVENSKTFSEQVDDILNNKYPKRDMLIVSQNTPKILQDIGLPNLPITMTQKHLYTITHESGKYTDVNYHNIDIDTIKKIPEALSKPLNVLKSDTKDDSIVVVTELSDKNDDIIVASIKINGKGQISDIQIDTNVMTSAYGKSNNYDYFMQDNINRGNLLYDIDEGIIKRISGKLQLRPTDSSSKLDATDRLQLSMRNSNERNSVSGIPKNVSPISNNDNTTNFSKSQIAPLPQYNMQQKTKNDTTKIKPPIAKQYQKNTIEEKIETSSIKSISNATKIANKYLDLSREERQSFQEKLKKYENKTYEEISNGKVYNEIKDIVRNFSTRPIESIDEEMKSVKRYIRNRNIKINDNLKSQITDYNDFKKSMFGKLKLSKDGISVDSLYNELSNSYPYYFDPNISTEADMLYGLADFMDKSVVDIQKYNLSEKEIDDCTSKIFNELKNGLMTNNKIQEIQQKIESKNYKLTRKEVREQLLSEMNLTPEDLSVGDDIKALNFQLTDPIRVNEKVFGQELGKKVNEVTIEKTKHNEAERTRWLNSERDDIKQLGIKPRSKESAAVQKYGEKQYVNKYGETVEYGDKELMTEFPNVKTQEKIKRASQMIRNKYDKYIDQINETLTALGYDEIPKRPDYMRHFQELGDIFSQTGVPFNLNDMAAEDLPTDINGLTEFNKPGKNWFASAQKRYGNKTTYDAITGIDGYLEGASNLIYHTEDIQRYRALSGLIRDSFGKTKGFENLDNLSNKEALKRIDDIQHNKLSKYVAWLDEQANSLANKKGAIDRGTERILGRRGYTALNTIKKQVGSNMTGFNVRSAMTNFISSTIAASKTNKIAMIKGTISTIRNMFHNDGFINKSDFLTSRFGSDSLSPKLWNKISNASQILMKGSDYFTSNQIVRSKYYEGLQRGMTETEAIKYADDFGSRVMGDRSKGATAEAFNSKTLGLLTQFQLETNNQWQFMVHDTKMDYQKNSKVNGGLKAGATVLFQLGQLCAYSYFFNEFFEAVTGSRAAFDPIDILLKLFGSDDDDKDKTFEERMQEAGDELISAIPFTGLFGKNGRMPISDALTPFETTFNYVTGKKNSYGGDVTREDVKNDILKTLPYYLLPTGYGQLKKTTKGLSMFSSDKEIKGSYSNSGRLRFPVKDTIGNKIQAGLFGEYASKEARDYVSQGRRPLTEKQQNMYKTLDIPISEYWTIKNDISNLKKELKGKKSDERQEEIYKYIDDLDISQIRKDILKKQQYKSYKSADNKIIKYINSSNMSKESKKEILKELGLEK